MFCFYAPEIVREPKIFFTISGGIKMDYWDEMG